MAGQEMEESQHSAQPQAESSAQEPSAVRISKQEWRKTDATHHERAIYQKLQDLSCVPKCRQLSEKYIWVEAAPGHRLCREDVKNLATVRSVIQAVYDINKTGVLHLDLKPEHIFVDDQTEPAKVTIIDFGLSEEISAPYRLGEYCGNLRYASVFMHLGDCRNPAADLQSLCFIFEHLSGGSSLQWSNLDAKHNLAFSVAVSKIKALTDSPQGWLRKARKLLFLSAQRERAAEPSLPPKGVDEALVDSDEMKDEAQEQAELNEFLDECLRIVRKHSTLPVLDEPMTRTQSKKKPRSLREEQVKPNEPAEKAIQPHVKTPRDKEEATTKTSRLSGTLLTSIKKVQGAMSKDVEDACATFWQQHVPGIHLEKGITIDGLEIDIWCELTPTTVDSLLKGSLGKPLLANTTLPFLPPLKGTDQVICIVEIAGLHPTVSKDQQEHHTQVIHNKLAQLSQRIKLFTGHTRAEQFIFGMNLWMAVLLFAVIPEQHVKPLSVLYESYTSYPFVTVAAAFGRVLLHEEHKFHDISKVMKRSHTAAITAETHTLSCAVDALNTKVDSGMTKVDSGMTVLSTKVDSAVKLMKKLLSKKRKRAHFPTKLERQVTRMKKPTKQPLRKRQRV
jgi:serine/threonine protein kinase